jgi:hypothetical protein
LARTVARPIVVAGFDVVVEAEVEVDRADDGVVSVRPPPSEEHPAATTVPTAIAATSIRWGRPARIVGDSVNPNDIALASHVFEMH